MPPLLRSRIRLLLLLLGGTTSLMAQPGDHALRVHIGDGKWVSRSEATAKGFFFYKDRWLSKKLIPKLKRWERKDAKVRSWRNAYRAKSKHYRIKTNAPHYITELELKPFLDELYLTYVKVFKSDFGLASRAADKNHIHIYWGFKTWLANENSDRGGPGFYERGVALKVMYDPTDANDFYNTVFHEGAHQFFMATLPGANLPVWLDEALATYFEGCTFSRSTGRITPNHLPINRFESAKYDILAARQSGKDVTPAAMFMDISDPARFDASHYALAWSYLHFLIHRDGGRHKRDFSKFLGKMNGAGSKSVQKVFKLATRKDLARIEKGWVPYVLSLEVPALPEWQVLSPRHAATDEDVKVDDLLVKIDGHRIDTEADWQRYWVKRDKTEPCKLLLLRQFNRKGPMNYEQKFVTLIVKPGSKLELDSTSTVPYLRNVVD